MSVTLDVIHRRVQVDPTTGCWLWSGAVTDGYGKVRVGRKVKLAHRASLEAVVGPLPPGTVVHHSCGVRRCVNPAHLRIITPAENLAESHHRRTLMERVAALEAEVERLRAACRCGAPDALPPAQSPVPARPER